MIKVVTRGKKSKTFVMSLDVYGETRWMDFVLEFVLNWFRTSDTTSCVKPFPTIHNNCCLLSYLLMYFDSLPGFAQA